MPYLAKIILDSENEFGDRLTTVELTYPLIVHNEFLTHRTIGRSDDHKYDQWLEASRNSSSNRAIPSATIIKAVQEDPYIPLRWGKSSKGMIPGENLPKHIARDCELEWLTARDEAVAHVKTLDWFGLAKQWRNRLLLPFQFITVVATANEEWWQHFIGLRNHEAAQDEIQVIAGKLAELYIESNPTILKRGTWHLPYLTEEENDNTSYAIQKSVARCARTSYLRQDAMYSVRDDIKLAEDLRYPASGKPHASPFEHQAMSTHTDVRSGNFVGWDQNRRMQGI